MSQLPLLFSGDRVPGYGRGGTPATERASRARVALTEGVLSGSGARSMRLGSSLVRRERTALAVREDVTHVGAEPHEARQDAARKSGKGLDPSTDDVEN